MSRTANGSPGLRWTPRSWLRAGVGDRGFTLAGSGRPVDGGRGRTWDERALRRVDIGRIVACRRREARGRAPCQGRRISYARSPVASLRHGLDVASTRPPGRKRGERCTLARRARSRGCAPCPRTECRNATRSHAQAPNRRRPGRSARSGRAVRTRPCHDRCRCGPARVGPAGAGRSRVARPGDRPADQPAPGRSRSPRPSAHRYPSDAPSGSAREAPGSARATRRSRCRPAPSGCRTFGATSARTST
jgi:hypothetical protein